MRWCYDQTEECEDEDCCTLQAFKYILNFIYIKDFCYYKDSKSTFAEQKLFSAQNTPLDPSQNSSSHYHHGFFLYQSERHLCDGELRSLRHRQFALQLQMSGGR